MPGGDAHRNRYRSSLQSSSACELRRPPLSASADTVLRRDAKRRVFALDLDRLDFDQVAEPLLQRALHEESHGGGELIAIWREDQLHQPTAEVRAVDALAGRGEENLLDQIADVRVAVGRRRAPASVEMIWVINAGHVSSSCYARLRHDGQ